MADLLGGTTGQILSKASNTNMDFTWIANDQGDITAVNVTSPITGGGTSGAVTIGVSAASTSASGVVQLSDSTSTTSSVLASTPTAVKAAYDLANTANTAAGTAQSTANSATTTANAAVPKSTVTTAGDVIYATGSAAVTRLGIGSTGQVLTVASGVPSWATPSASSSTKLTYVTPSSDFTTSSTSLVDATGYTITFTPNSATNKIKFMFDGAIACAGEVGVRLMLDGVSIGVRNFVGNDEGKSIVGYTTNLSAASHTIKLQVRSNGGVSSSLYGSTSGYYSNLSVLEVY
jgi:hypothetical protein